MGILDQVVGALSSGASSSPQGVTPQQHAGLGGLVLEMLSGSGGGGGLEGLVQAFGRQGLGHVVASWIGTGQNLPISADQLNQALGSEQVKAMAAKVGLSPEAASSVLAGLLPALVDKATPTGRMPEGGPIEAFGALRKSLGL